MGDDDLLVRIGDATLVPARQHRQCTIRVGKDVPGGRFTKDHAFEQRIACQAICAVQAGAGGLADRVQTLEVRSCAQVRHHAAAGVVRRRHDRNRLAGDIDAQFQAATMDGGEMLEQEIGRFVADVEEDAVQTVFLHLEIDRAGDDVARSEFGAWIVIGHEAISVGQPQDSAFAPHGFADQKGFRLGMVETGWVKLDELHVRDPAACAPGHRDPVSRRGVRIRGVEVDLARAPGGEHGVARREADHMVVFDVQHVGAQAAFLGPADLVADDQVDRNVVFEDRNVGVGKDLLAKRLLDCGTGRVGGVDDAPVRVSAFAGEVVANRRRVVLRKGNPFRDQPLDGLAAMFDDEPGCFGIAQAGAGRVGVPLVIVKTVGGVEYRRDTTLRPGAGTIREAALGDQCHLERIGKAQCHRLSGQATAENEDVELDHGSGAASGAGKGPESNQSLTQVNLNAASGNSHNGT